MAAGHVVPISVRRFGCLQPRSRVRMRVVKMAALAVPHEQENALAVQRSSFRENPTYFLTSVGRWVCKPVLDAIYDWRSEFSLNTSVQGIYLTSVTTIKWWLRVPRIYHCQKL